MSSAGPILLFGLAGFCLGGVYALYTQQRPLWLTMVVALFGVLCAVAGWLYL